MDIRELLDWAKHGSLLTRTLALLVLDEITDGEVTRIYEKRLRTRGEYQ